MQSGIRFRELLLQKTALLVSANNKRYEFAAVLCRGASGQSLGGLGVTVCEWLTQKRWSNCWAWLVNVLQAAIGGNEAGTLDVQYVCLCSSMTIMSAHCIQGIQSFSLQLLSAIGILIQQGVMTFALASTSLFTHFPCAAGVSCMCHHISAKQ